MQPNGNTPGAGRPVAGAPVSNVNTKPAPVPTPPPAPKPAEPTFGNGDSVVEGKGGKKTGWILAIVLLLIVATGGIGFGVWAMMDGNAQKDALNEQINALKQQNNDSQNELDNGSSAADGKSHINPVIVSQDSENTYTISFSSSKVLGGTNALGESTQVLDISVVNGEIVQCSVSDATYHEGGGVSKTNSKDCVVNGLDGDIYKIVEFGAGHDNLNDVIGFIMTDGVVYYLPLYDSVQNENYDIRGKVNLPGKVVDILTTGVDNGVTGWVGTVFVLDDGTIVEYDNTMLN